MYSNSFDTLLLCLPEYLEERKIDPTKMFKCLNPEHVDSTPSSNVYKEKYIKCFGCQKVYTIFDLASMLENLPARGTPNFFRDNVCVLAKRYGVYMPTWSESSSLQVFQNVIEYVSNQFLEEKAEKLNISTTEVLENDWLPSSKLSSLQTKELPICIKAPSLEELNNHLLDSGLDQLQINLSGLEARIFPKKETFIYPLWVSNGVCVGFSTRNAYSDTPKYINTPNNDCFVKGKYLYGLFFNPDPKKSLYLVEGQKDCLATWSIDIQSVAGLTSTLTDDQVDLIRDSNFSDIVVCFDGDDAGRKGALVVIDKFLKRGIKIGISLLPNDSDPYEYIIENNNTSLPASICGVSYLINTKLLTETKTQVTEYITDIISFIDKATRREILAKEISSLLDISSKALIEDIEDIIKKRNDKTNNLIVGSFKKALTKSESEPSLSIKYFEEAFQYASNIKKVNTFFDNSFTMDLITATEKGENNYSDLDIHFRKDGLGIISDILHEDGIGWTQEAFFAIGGDSHAGKSALSVQIVAEALIDDPECMIIHWATDDSSKLLFPRLVSSLAFNTEFKIADSINTNLIGAKKIIKNKAINTIKEWVKSDRLIMKDLNFTGLLSKMHDLVKYYRDKYPDRKLILINDNFHRNLDYPEKDETSKVAAMSSDAKGMTVKEKMAYICTAEYTKAKKFGPSNNNGQKKRVLGVGPSTADFAGSRAFGYNANVIINLQNDYIDNNCNIDKCLMVHEYRGQLFPRVNLIISKNKVSGKTPTIPMDLFPYSSFFRYVDPVYAAECLQQRMKELGLDDGFGG